MLKTKSFGILVLFILSAVLPVPPAAGWDGSTANNSDLPMRKDWSVTRVGSQLQIAYWVHSQYPQFGVLHLDSGYFRLVQDEGAGWGTSIVLLPAFWSGGKYYQGADKGSIVTAEWVEEGNDLVLTINGSIHGLSVTSRVQLSPPGYGRIKARVISFVTGDVPIDSRPGEAFKPVFLSSMHIDPAAWDAQSAFVGNNVFSIPQAEWIVPNQKPLTATTFGLLGGTSVWKKNAPAVQITLPEPLRVTGWVTASSDPNDDNVGLWAAADGLLRRYEYTITVSGENAVPCNFIPYVTAGRQKR